MKNKLVSLIGIMTALWSIHIRAEELCTEGFLFNASFDDVDNLGIPLDWKTRGDYDNRGLAVEDGVLKIWVNDGGNHDGGGVLFLGQTFKDKMSIISTLGNDTMYLRAWVKSTAIEEPTDEELIAAFLKDDPDRDTSGTNFRHNVGSHGGFELVVQEALGLTGPPWFVPIEWTPWYDHDGAAIDDWKAVNGKVVLKSPQEINHLDFWILLRSKSACTVWIDNIQISSSPEFCGETFEQPGPVSINQRSTDNKKNHVLKILNHSITFGGQSKYDMKIFNPNGQVCLHRSGNESVIDLQKYRLPAGMYIIDLKTERRDFVQTFTIQTNNR